MGIVIFPWKSFRIFSSSAPDATVSLINFYSEEPSTRSELSKAQGGGFTIHPVSGRLFVVEPRAWLEFPLAGDESLTTLHMSAWVESPGRMTLSLVNAITEEKIVLSRRRILLHRSFDLTPYLKKDLPMKLRLEMEGLGEVLEFSVRRNSVVPQFPPVHEALAWLLSVWILYCLWFKTPREAFGGFSLLLALLVAGFWLRWNQLAPLSLHPLEGDALGYFDEASRLNWMHPFQSGTREPFYIMAQAMVLKCGGNAVLLFRVFTVLLSMALIPLTYFLTLRLFKDPMAALVSAGLMVFGDLLIFNSVRGERVELNAVLLLLFFIGMLRPRGRVRREAFLGLTGGLFCITWLAGLPTLGLMAIYRWRVARLPWKHVLAFAGGALLVLLPHFIDQWQRFGDPLQALNAHVNYYRGTADGVKETSWANYLLDKGGAQVVVSTSRGYFNMLLNLFHPANKTLLGFHYSQWYSFILWPFLMGGLVISIQKKFWLPWLMMLATLHITPSHLDKIQDPRLFLHAAPWVAAFVGLGLSTGVNRLKNRVDLPFRRRRK